MPITARTASTGMRSTEACGNKVRLKRRRPYAPNFSSTPARITEPAVGASTWGAGGGEDAGEHQRRAQRGEQEELDGGIPPPLAAPGPDDEVHRDQHHLPEDEEDEQVEGDEDAEAPPTAEGHGG